MSKNQQKKLSTRELLMSIQSRLIRIEEVLRANSDRLNLMDLIPCDNISLSDDDEYMSDSNLQMRNDSIDSESDEDEPIIEESYDSDNDFPRERTEVFPEPPLLLTPLQVELANKEFMHYHNGGCLVDERAGGPSQLNYAHDPNLQMHTDPWADTRN